MIIVNSSFGYLFFKPKDWIPVPILVYVLPDVAAAISPMIIKRSAIVYGTAGPLLSMIRPTTRVPIIYASRYVLNIQPNMLRPFKSTALEGAMVVTQAFESNGHH
ncbi:hypothetical protein [Paenibacillus sp. FSL H7-0714]|uniref:hypothetical protein n=1 Tax=Paenibacillus sp. FSL H7-0714 TaxID=2954735 RepID=UPI0030F959A6